MEQPKIGRVRQPRMSRRQLLGLVGAGAGLGVASALPRELLAAVAPLQAAARAATVAFPKDAVIRTLLKDVSPDTLGTAATLFHEHLVLRMGASAADRTAAGRRPVPAKDVTLLSDQLNIAASRRRRLHRRRRDDRCRPRRGVPDPHRRARPVSIIVACGGLYMQRTYPADVATKSEDQIADDLVQRRAAPPATARSAKSARLQTRP